MFDLRGQAVTTVCPCGCDLWDIWVKFDDDGVIAGYAQEMSCKRCGTTADAPMPGVNI